MLVGLTDILIVLRMLESAPRRWKEDELDGNSQLDKKLGRASGHGTTRPVE